MLRFTRRWKQFREGDPVPDTFDGGTLDALRTRQAIADDGAAEAKQVEAPPRDKMVRPDRVRTK